MQYAKIGSISTGTHIAAELAQEFAIELNNLAKRDESDPERKQLANKAAAHALDLLAEEETDEMALAQFVHEEAPGVFELYCAPFTFFGTAPGNGSDYGFWPDIGGLEDAARSEDGVIKVNAGDEWPDIGQDIFQVMEVNDHGNVTLYDAHTRQELWSCV